MEVDTIQKLYFVLVRECYYYRDSNYMVAKCLVWLDIRHLTIKQQKELIEDLNTLKNTC